MPDLFVAKDKKPSVYSDDTTVATVSKDVLEAKRSDPEEAPGTVTIQKREMHPFSTFHMFPEGISFENQESDEVIHLFVRRHFVTNIRWIVGTVLFALLPPIIFLVQNAGILTFPDTPTSYVLVISLFYYLILFGYVLINITSWFYNIGLVTQLRVIDIDLSNIQQKNISATILSDIVDVSYSQKGFLQSFFDYGDVVLQTEGIKENFEFLKIPHPAKAADIISDLIAGREVVND